MSNVNSKTTLNLKSNLLTIKANTSLAKTFEKIRKSKRLAIIHITKPVSHQMAAVLFARLIGNKFYWIQGFENPPIPGFFTKLLLSQADRIIVTSKKDIYKLKKFGVDKSKIRYQKN